MNVTDLSKASSRQVSPKLSVRSEHYRRKGIVEHDRFDKEVTRHMTSKQSAVKTTLYIVLRLLTVGVSISGITLALYVRFVN